jgi:hypothetical protein
MRSVALVLSLSSVAGAVLQADSLNVRLRGDRLFVSVPRMDLLGGPVLSRLKNGTSVAFDFHLALWVGNRGSVRRRAFERFVVSYDLWEERFAVTNLRKPRASASGLAEREVESWCLDKIALPAVDLSREKVLWAKLEVRAVEPARDAELFDSNGISLSNLVELLSRPARRDESRWSFESGAIQVAGLRREESQ